jgi:K+-transporting ATPase ATPase C chain
MKPTTTKTRLIGHLIASGRIVLGTMFICSVLYTLIIYGIGQLVAPHTANGSLLYNANGEIVGSEAIGQTFTKPEYFQPRPSAVSYNAAATGGSNLSPTNPALRARAEEIIASMSIWKSGSIPADLVTASGSGVDPHISLAAAKYQAPRVAASRGIMPATVNALIDRQAVRTGGVFTSEALVNVLLLNMKLDEIRK